MTRSKKSFWNKVFIFFILSFEKIIDVINKISKERGSRGVTSASLSARISTGSINTCRKSGNLFSV
ncbi:MAG: hypothetical protein A2Y41_04535 [Spirochaetes bacterium GWB1_36_13]|nr:MAG: hypothetical protein A2Y41_04535 [Spirochaetes bacterium GWB1_36_13]